MEQEKAKTENELKKEYLWGYRKHTRKIKRIEEEIDEIRSLKMYPSLNNDGMPHGTGQADLSGYAAELQEREDELYKEGVEQFKTHKDIMFKIKQLENEDERDVLFYRYIKGKQFWEIANDMDYCESWIHKLHSRALKNLKIS